MDSFLLGLARLGLGLTAATAVHVTWELSRPPSPIPGPRPEGWVGFWPRNSAERLSPRAPECDLAGHPFPCHRLECRGHQGPVAPRFRLSQWCPYAQK